MTGPRKTRTALVLAGGGTRGAYEAGVIAYIRTRLPPKLAQEFSFQILCGSSVGAINAVYLAATADQPLRQGEEIVRMWRDIRTEDIYRSGAVTLSKLFIRTFFGVLSHVVGIRGLKRRDDDPLHFQGFFDTSPFFHFLRDGFAWSNVTRNLESGIVHAIAVSATNMTSGEVEVFLQKRPEVPHSPRIIFREVRLSPRHIMASAALPLLFPPVPIQNTYYNDGGLRLGAPLAPAVSLGASRILLIGTHYKPTKSEVDTMVKMEDAHYPTLGEILGKVYHSILLDRLQLDREQVERINRVLLAAQKYVPAETYRSICEEAKVERIEELPIFPSINIATLVDETVRGSLKNLRTFGSLERFILRILETDPHTGNDFLSYFLFEPIYLKKLIDLGYEDARAKHDQLCALAEHSIEDRPVG